MANIEFILAGRLIDGTGAAVQRNIFLTVTSGIITAIGPAATLPERSIKNTTDFSHCTLLPALVDCSLSLQQSPSVDEPIIDHSQQELLLKRQIYYCHSHGVLGVATSDRLSKQTTGNQGGLVTIKQSRNHNPKGENFHDNRSGDGDFVKITISANIEDETAPTSQNDPQKLRQTLQQIQNRKTVVVANGVKQVAAAIGAGCHAIEQGYNMGRDNLETMAKKDILWIPSALRAKNKLDGVSTGGDVCCRFSQRYVAPGKPMPGAETYWQEVLAEQLSLLRQARELGVKTAVGTGAGSIGILHGESMVEEMKLFIKAGYALEETIRCGSETGAHFFEMNDLGSLTCGNRATFLITRGTPKQLPRKLSYLEGIYINGRPSSIYHKNPSQH